MVSKPNIDYSRPASLSNVWQYKTVKRKTAIVCHTMGGTYEGTLGWFQNPNSQASTNFCVAQDGRIACTVDPWGPHSPYANGYIDRPDQEFLTAYRLNGSVNPNYWTISIEHEDFRRRTQITAVPRMFEASTHLSAWLCQEFQLDPHAYGVFLGHYQIDGVNRSYCPGWYAETWDAYIGEVNRKLNGHVEAPDMQMEERMARLERVVAARINGQFDENGNPKAEGWIEGGGALDFLAKGDGITQFMLKLGWQVTRLEQIVGGNGLNTSFYPDKEPGTPGSVDEAHWLRGNDALRWMNTWSLGQAIAILNEKVRRLQN